MDVRTSRSAIAGVSKDLRRPDPGSHPRHTPISDEIKPEPIKDHGTMVVLLGASDYDDTMAAPEQAPSPSRWIARYLNTR